MSDITRNTTHTGLWTAVAIFVAGLLANYLYPDYDDSIMSAVIAAAIVIAVITGVSMMIGETANPASKLGYRLVAAAALLAGTWYIVGLFAPSIANIILGVSVLAAVGLAIALSRTPQTPERASDDFYTDMKDEVRQLQPNVAGWVTMLRSVARVSLRDPP
jgi:hypothetical protein